MESDAMKNERFLVTGALGCIGAWVVRNLVREGAAPVVFDLPGEPRRPRMIMTPEEMARVRFVAGDITDLGALERALDEHAITHVIHLAALQIPFCRADPPLGARVNVVGTVNVLQAVARRRDRIGPVVYASSVAALDTAPSGSPTTLYGVYKQANEGTADVFWQESRVSSIGLRPCIVYGPGRDQGVTSAVTRAMFAAAVGREYRIPFGNRTDYQYADDVAKTFLACARASFEGAAVFNLRGSVASIPEVVAAIEAAAPESRGRITFSETRVPAPEQFDAAPLIDLIGPLPHTPLPEGVAATVACFRELVASGQMAADAMLE
jgi:nucleoside-diphosphate-sugar epimerase